MQNQQPSQRRVDLGDRQRFQPLAGYGQLELRHRLGMLGHVPACRTIFVRMLGRVRIGGTVSRPMGMCVAQFPMPHPMLMNVPMPMSRHALTTRVPQLEQHDVASQHQG